MNIKKRIFTLLLSCVCVIGSGSIASAEVQPRKTTIGYDFPIKPGTTSWNELKDTSARVKACVIPEGILKKLTTDQLIETILNYPFMRDIYAYNTTQEGFLSVSKKFNGLSELLQRNDAATALIAKYKNMQVLTDATKITLDNSNQIFDMAYIEILLAQNQISAKATKTEKIQIQDNVYYKYLQKKAHSDIYGFTQETYYDLQPQSLAETVGYYTIYTPNGSPVSVFKRSPDFTSIEKLNNDNYVKTSFPNTTLLASSTKRYNCHSYAWYSTSSLWNSYWMDSPQPYISDGSYKYSSIALIGAKIYYNYGEHSGIVTSTNSSYPARVTSKWGGLGLVSHMYNNCPYSYFRLAYYK